MMVKKQIFEKKIPYTIVRNEVFDDLMPKLSYPAWKVLCAIIRATMGWRKMEDELSYRQLLERTGIKNRTTLSKAIKELQEADYIHCQPSQDGVSSNVYSLNDAYILLSGSTGNVLPGSTGNGLGVVQEMDSQNKILKKDSPVRKRTGRKRDPLLDHWAVQTHRKVAHKYFEIALRPMWVEFAERQYDGDGSKQLESDLGEWLAHGYYKMNLSGFIDWVENGKQGRQKRGTRKGSDKSGPDYDDWIKEREAADGAQA